ncbi:MAG: class B sortase [Lachnospiraceae bacterium]|nr:class B sortase [Lachnospiraceae bacterium]
MIDKKRNNRKPGVILRLSYIIAGTCLVVSLFGLYRIYKDYHRSYKIYEQVKEDYTKPKQQKTKDEDQKPSIEVDLERLREQYPDVLAWLHIPEVLSYPVMYGEDNQTYLHRSYNKQENPGGSLFFDQNDNPDLSDRHMIIYGHNMKDGSMFGRLKEYLRDREFRKDHPCFYLYDGRQERKYRIVSCRQVDYMDDIYTIYGKSDTGYRQFAEKVLGLSDEQARMPSITLSTCSVTNRRFVITGVLETTRNTNTK